MWRRSTFESVEEMREGPAFRIGELKCGLRWSDWVTACYAWTNLKDIAKDVLLHDRIVNPNTPSTNFHPIENKIVVLSTDLI